MTPLQASQGSVPVMTFNGADEAAETPDATYWSRDDSGNNPMSIGAWVYPAGGSAERFIMAKWSSGNREWSLGIDGSAILTLVLFDDAANALIKRAADSALSLGVWNHVVAVYDSTGGATAANGITLHINGAAVASTATNNGSYASMVNGAGLVTLAFRNSAAPELFWDSEIAGGPCGPFFTHKELSASEVEQLHRYCRMLLDLS